MRRPNREEQRLLAFWAADCAERVLPFFEKAKPNDRRPREALKACRAWARTGVFSMAVIRKASLSSHAAARAVKSDAARFAARAAGQAVATAHVPEHAFGAAYYALRAVAAANPDKAHAKVVGELAWQTRRLPKKLRRIWLDFQRRRFPRSLKQILNVV